MIRLLGWLLGLFTAYREAALPNRDRCLRQDRRREQHL